MTASEAAQRDSAFNNPDDGIWYQARILAYMTFVQPTVEDELLAHALGVRLVETKSLWWKKVLDK